MLDRGCEVSELTTQGKDPMRFHWSGALASLAHPTEQIWNWKQGRNQDGELLEKLILMLQIKLWSSPDMFPSLHLRERKKKKVKYEFWEHC